MVLSIYNHKGGTGKTTTTINLGRVLKDIGYDVLLVDLDPQANMTYSLGIQKTDVDAVNLSEDNIILTEEGLNILPNYTSPQFLVDYEFLSPTSLRDELATCFSGYDFVLIDCPPAMNNTVVNALLASDAVLLPVLLDVLSLEALNQVNSAMTLLLEDNNHKFDFTCVLPVMVDSRRLLTTEIKKVIMNSFNVYIFENHIRMNVKTAEAPSHGKSVLAYSPSSNGSFDYKRVAEEFLSCISNL
ncbi:MAG: ParA family protein [Cyclobacteriaceae bacterium]|nr:ParA family protein [Cyclobacteriaceae bacterium]